MKAYGFPDEEIANALRARGLYDTTPAVLPTAPVQPDLVTQLDLMVEER